MGFLDFFRRKRKAPGMSRIESLGQPISDLYELTSEIEANLNYILKEIRTLDAPKNLEDRVCTVCEEFENTLRDVKKEIRVLEDKLGMHPGEEPFDPGVVNPDPKVTIGLIDLWLGKSIDQMHNLIKSLEGSKDPDTITVYVLCAESGANILNCYRQIKDNLDLIAKRLE